MRSSANRSIDARSLKLGALALVLTAAGCGAPEDDIVGGGTEGSDPVSTPTPATGSGSISRPVPAATGAGLGGEQLEGRIEQAVYDDFKANKFRTDYFLRTADGRRLKLDLGTSRETLPVGKFVRLRASKVGARFVVDMAPGGVETVENLGDPNIAPHGARTYAVVMVKLADDPNMPFTQDDMRTMIFTGPTSVNKYIQENSFGKVSMTGINRWDGDIFGWVSVPHLPVCGDCCGEHLALADQQLAQQGVDLNAYNNVTYLVPGMEQFCGNSGFAYDSVHNVVQAVSEFMIAHELGHNFGAPHARAYTCFDAGNVRVPLAPDSQCLTNQEYGDLHDVMGLGLRHMNAFNKLRLGYMVPGNLTTWTADGDFVIKPVEQHVVGTQAVRVPRPAATYEEATSLYLHFRQPLGMFDTVFPPSHPAFNGISLHVGSDTQVFGPHSHTIDTELETPDPVYGNEDAAVQVGQAFHDPIARTTVQPLSVSAASSTVRVLGNRNPIKINFQPAAAPTVAGYLVDSGAVYGNRGNGFSYGWNVNNPNAVDLNSAETPGQDQRYDTFNKMQQPGGGSVWELAVTNGSYLVRVAAGDVSTSAVYKIAVEGVLVLDKTPIDEEKWFQRARVVTVNDGRLTVTNGAGASNNKINFIEVVSLAQASTVFTANFNSTADSFTYADNTFRGATQSSYASGVRQPNGGVGNTGNLQVALGGINNDDIFGMSGGWGRTFSLTTASSAAVTFSYNMTQTAEYESDELSDVLVAIDGTLVGVGPNDYVARITGNGPGGAPLTTGWKTVTLNLGMLGAGNHTVTIGGYNNKKTDSNESTDIRIDDVTVRRN
jgi:hypothetical protein